MILKRGGSKLYGIPYQGSKSKIIEKIARFFPNADNFYDLFGGGFSVSHYMIENRSKSYKQFHYNELRPGLCELIQDAIDGKYSLNNGYKPEWISRERFLKEKDTNAFIKIIWSFGNNGKGYLFGKDIEQQKRSMHMAVVFNEFDDYIKQKFKIDKWPNDLSITAKRLYLTKRLNRKNRNDLPQLEQFERLQQLEQLEQLERFQQLEQLEHKRIVLTNLDYRSVEIKQNSVIYCDIPYFGTVDYGNSFSHKDFFDWAYNQENPLFISEYKVDDDRFYMLKEINHRTKMSPSDNNAVTERLYGNKIAYDIIQKHLNK